MNRRQFFAVARGRRRHFRIIFGRLDRGQDRHGAIAAWTAPDMAAASEDASAKSVY
jgi:hypothetical protein